MSRLSLYPSFGLLLALPATPPADAADALGVAVCHGHQRETRRRMASSQPQREVVL